MLDNERWWNAREGLVSFCQRRELSHPSEYYKQVFLDEQFRTQKALDILNFSLEEPVSSLPYINEIISPRYILPSNALLAISVIGMPGAAKTSTIRDFIAPLSDNKLNIIWEPARSISTFLNEDNPLYYEQLYFTQTSHYIEKWSELGEQYNPAGLSVFDRNWVDIPFKRANFLYGRFNPELFADDNQTFLDLLKLKPRPAHAIVNCLVKPEGALSRETEEKSYHKVMQLPFLQVLYEQYIRFHWESSNFEKVYNQPRPFIYSAVDMSSKDEYSNHRALEKVINWIKIFQNFNEYNGAKIFTLPEY